MKRTSFYFQINTDREFDVNPIGPAQFRVSVQRYLTHPETFFKGWSFQKDVNGIETHGLCIVLECVTYVRVDLPEGTDGEKWCYDNEEFFN